MVTTLVSDLKEIVFRISKTLKCKCFVGVNEISVQII